MSDGAALASAAYDRARVISADRGLALERLEFFGLHDGSTLIGLNAAAPTVRVSGSDNAVLVGSRSHARKLSVEISGSNNLVVIGPYARLGGSRVNIVGNDSIFWFGAQSSADDMIVMIREGQSVIVGDDCMFSARIILETTDHHPIFDRLSGTRVNGPGSVVIGNHVWLGRDVRVGKGSIIGEGSIVGQGSMVSGDRCAEPFTLYAGIPARQIRQNVEWAHQKSATLSEYHASAYAANRVAQRAWLAPRLVA